MSILGYSSSYFLPQYWAGTPFYGEKLIPLLDYILSTDYVHTDQLATAFYNIESKYKNTADLPIEQIEAIIEESGYGYVRALLGQNEESLRLLVYLLVLIHQLKGSKRGIEVVLNLLRKAEDNMVMSKVGDIQINDMKEVTGFSTTSYVLFSNLDIPAAFELNFQIKTGANFNTDQCIASAADHGFYLGINTEGKVVLKLGKRDESIMGRSWQEIDGETVFISDRMLARNTNYLITFNYDNYEYNVKISTDSVKYDYYLTKYSEAPLNIVGGTLYIGIDRSEQTTKDPFKGVVYLGPFTISSNNVKITQWFETFPVGKENTFSVESAIDGETISADFFMKFVEFTRNYVYPTLEAFKAKLSLKGKVVFIPYSRQIVNYVAFGGSGDSEDYLVKKEQIPTEWYPYEVQSNVGTSQNFKVVKDND